MIKSFLGIEIMEWIILFLQLTILLKCTEMEIQIRENLKPVRTENKSETYIFFGEALLMGWLEDIDINISRTFIFEIYSTNIVSSFYMIVNRVPKSDCNLKIIPKLYTSELAFSVEQTQRSLPLK